MSLTKNLPPIGDIHSRLIISPRSIYRDNYIQNMKYQTADILSLNQTNVKKIIL